VALGDSGRDREAMAAARAAAARCGDEIGDRGG
jgi:hypothetical protein